VPLGSIAEVRRAPAEPRLERARLDGAPTVVLGVIPRDAIDAVAFGEDVRAVLAEYRTEHPQWTLTEIAYQPDKVSGRLGELGLSLLLGVGIVLLVLFLTMGPRLGVVVGSVVPLVTFASLAIYAAGGGVLHQMAVAALVLALGLLVDNAIVMAEAIQHRLDAGASRAEAMRGAVSELAIPLASATATTLASFVPMLLAPGTTGDFTRAIPIVVMITLSASYVYALVVTPLVGGFLLRPRASSGDGWVERAARWIAQRSVKRPGLTLAAVGLVVGGAGAFATIVQKDFFPSSDREQLVVSVELPEGAHLDATDDASRRLERALSERREVVSVAAFVGRSAPSFYYNLPRAPRSPHLAHVVVTTRSAADVGAIRTFVRAWSARELPDATVVPRRLEQGPPVPAPIEVRLLGDDLADLHLAAEQVQRVLREDPRAADVRTTQGPGVPTLGFAIDDAVAGRRGVARAQIASAMLGRTEGLRAGSYRGGEDPVPIVVRASAGDAHAPEQLDAIDLVSAAGWTPLGAVTTRDLSFGPAVIQHRDGRRVVSVLAEVEDGSTYAQIIADARPRLEALELPSGVSFVLGGATESSAKANDALASRAWLGALLLVVVLIAQFESLRRVAIVLVTAPLAALGIWPGLFALDLPFGFVALLGAIALIGIAVNAAIVLLDLTESLRAEGASIAAALEAAVTRRTRPILLTTVTTIAGLVPLLFSESTLWPPMAAAMISGLTVATALTLFAVPALYRLLFRDPKPTEARPLPLTALGSAAAAMFALSLIGSTPAFAQTDAPEPAEDMQALLQGEPEGMTVDDVRARALEVSPSLDAQRAAIRAAEARVPEAWAAILPQVQVGGRYTRLSEIENDPLVSGIDPSGAQALVAGVDDPEARALWESTLTQQQALAQRAIPFYPNQLAFDATIQLPLSELFLTLVPRLEAADAGVDAARSAERAVQHALRLRSAEAFYAVARARAYSALAAQRVIDVEEQARLARVAEREGAALLSERLRAEAQLARARSASILAQARLAAGEEALRALLHLEPTTPLSLATLDAPPSRPPASLAALTARAIERRPETEALRDAMRASDRTQQAAEGARWPVLRVAFGAQLANPNPRFVPQHDRFDPTWDLSVILGWSPNQTIAADAQASRASAETARLRADLESLHDTLRIEVASAYADRRIADAQRDEADAALRAAAEAYRARQREREAGSANTAALLDAETELAAARFAWIDAAIFLHLAEARLGYAAGE
ncbi:MAG: efflux RND transporter permease subunit, partial [Sandaracinaceae bacterium]